MQRATSTWLLWILLAIYAAARFLEVFPGPLGIPVVVALHVVPALVFALVHGAMLYRWRGILVFVAICLLVGNGIENLGVATGIPFGAYYFTGQMGPKLLHVPVLLGLAYIGMGYLSWVLARLIVGGRFAAQHSVLVAGLAALVMVAWDLAQDPTWSTLVRCWVWIHGGPYFGVPVTNFFGWYVTVFCIYLTFALYLRKRAAESPAPTHSQSSWTVAVMFYGVSAVGNVLPALRPTAAIVADPSGHLWRVSDINAAAALVSLFAMGGFAIVAWTRLRTAAGDTGNAQRGVAAEVGD